VHECTLIWYITHLSPHIYSHLVQPYAHSLSILIFSQTYTSLIHRTSATLHVHTYLLVVSNHFNHFNSVL